MLADVDAPELDEQLVLEPAHLHNLADGARHELLDELVHVAAAKLLEVVSVDEIRQDNTDAREASELARLAIDRHPEAVPEADVRPAGGELKLAVPGGLCCGEGKLSLFHARNTIGHGCGSTHVEVGRLRGATFADGRFGREHDARHGYCIGES